MALESVFGFALGSRVIMLLLNLLFSAFGSEYDSSESAVTQMPRHAPATQVCSFLNAFVRWDAVYFLGIAQNGGYQNEQEFAFFPGYPLAMHLLAKFLRALLILTHCIDLILGSVCSDREILIVSGLIISNASFIAASMILFALTKSLFKSKRIAWLSAVVFCLSPSGIFLSSLYSESFFAMLSFGGMLLYSQKKHFPAAILWSVGSFVRSNGIVYIGFFLWVIITSQRRLTWQTLYMLFCSIIVLIPFCLFQAHAYVTFCTLDASRPWCHHTIPLIYSFVQKEYWNNGFLRYYELKQIPNFLLAGPILILSFAGIGSYVMHDLERFLTLGKVQKKISRGQEPYFSSKLLPFLYLWLVMTVIVSTMMHVQVILRFFTCLPPLYWFMAHLLERSLLKREKSSLLLSYLILYPLVGLVLFSNFYPPA